MLNGFILNSAVQVRYFVFEMACKNMYIGQKLCQYTSARTRVCACLLLIGKNYSNAVVTIILLDYFATLYTTIKTV